MSTKTKESKKIALYSLLIMGIGFIATIPFQDSFWILLLQGGFEAGLVGGLADWFAVTALFRHPLGLRIPHTALLPNNRERITNTLVQTIKRDWLSKKSIQEKVKQIPFTEKLIPLLSKQINTEIFRKTLIKLIKRMIASIEIEKITPIVKKQIISTLSNIELNKFLELLSSQLLKEEFDKRALDYVLQKAEVWLHQKDTSHKLGTVSMNVLNNIELDGILQFAVKSLQNLLSEEKLGNIIKNILLSSIQSLKHQEDPNRRALLLYLQNEIQGMNENKQFLETLEKWKHQFLVKWEPDGTITEMLHNIQQRALDFVEDPVFMDTYLMPFIYQIVDNLTENSSLIDHWIQEQITIFVENNHSHIGNLVQENLNKLNNEQLIDMVENNLGKDLQWIRVNGAVCGFIIGVFLTGIHALLSLI